jgi:hypothetical protein
VRVEEILDDLGESVRSIEGVELNSGKTEVCDCKKVVPINQLYYMKPEKSHATEELVGYTKLSVVLMTPLG